MMDQAKKPRFSKQLTISTFRCTPCLNCIPLGGTIAVTLRFTAHAFHGQNTRINESSISLEQLDDKEGESSREASTGANTDNMKNT